MGEFREPSSEIPEDYGLSMFDAVPDADLQRRYSQGNDNKPAKRALEALEKLGARHSPVNRE